MSIETKAGEGPLASYRVLDLTDEKGFLCGRVLGDLGADVIKIELPGGDVGRRVGPFYRDAPSLNRSLYWFAYNANKRGITLNIETAEGRDIFKTLVKSADFVIESSPPGFMDSIGLGYAILSQVNPKVIMVSITPFGQNGPWRDYKGSDIALWALSSYMYVTGDEDRPPVQPSFPQSYLHAGLEASGASLAALHNRQLTGQGQWVDVSAHDALTIVSLVNQQYWDLARFNPRRAGAFQQLSGVRWSLQRRLWRCRDGFVTFLLFSGHLGIRGNQELANWMNREGLAPECMMKLDWATFDPQGHDLTDEEHVQIMSALDTFFKRHTKKELYETAVEKGIVLYPCNTIEDVMKDIHLMERGFWVEIEHPEIGVSLTYPRPCMTFSQTYCGIRRCAPLIGEHNEEIYSELGFSGEQLAELKERDVV